MIPRRLQSPLLGTGIVMAALAVLAVPLHRLTANSGHAAGSHAPAETNSSMPDVVNATMRVKTIDPLSSLEIRDDEGRVIYQMKGMEPGETETDVQVAWHDGEIDLTLSARSGGKETAVFVTLLPDALEERSAHAIGSGDFSEILHFHWEHE